jgi:hypothetical protein
VPAEEVDARCAGETFGEPQLREIGVAAQLRQHQQIVEAGHAEAARALDQQVQEIGGGERVVECAMRRLMVEAQSRRERAELAIGNLVAHETARERTRVECAVDQPRSAGAQKCRIEERLIEAHVVADEDRAAHPFEQRGQHALDARRAIEHRLRDAGEHRDLRRHRAARIDERVKGAEAFAAAHLDRADLGDRALGRGRTGGLEVEHAEGDLGERRSQFVEAALHAPEVLERVFVRQGFCERMFP